MRGGGQLEDEKDAVSVLPQFNNYLIAGTIGSGLFFAWFYLTLFSSVVILPLPATLHIEPLFRSLAFLSFAASLILALAGSKWVLRYKARVLLSVISPLMALPLYLLTYFYSSSATLEINMAAEMIAWVLFGLSCFSFALNTSVFLSSLEPRTLPFLLPITLLVGCFAYWTIELASFPLNVLLTASLPFLTSLANYFTDAPSLKRKYDFHVEHRASHFIDYLRLGNTLTPLQALFGVVFGFAIATGIFLEIDQSGAWHTPGEAVYPRVISIFLWLPGLFLLVHFLIRRKTLDFEKASWVLMTICLIALLAIPFSNQNISFACCCILVFCFSLFDCLHLQSTALLAQELTGDGLVLFCTNRFFVYLGVFLGYFASRELLHYTGYESSALAICFYVIAAFYIAFITYYYLKSLLPKQEIVPQERGAGRWRTACEKVCEEAGLSARQKEVFFLLAKGRNSLYIQESLVISNHTVKAHIYRIYQKLDVHSQQELIDKVEEKIASNKTNI